MNNKKERKTKTPPKNVKKTIIESAPVKTQKPMPESKRTIKQAVIELISADNAISNEGMIAAVKAEFPKSALQGHPRRVVSLEGSEGTLDRLAHLHPGSIETQLT